MSRRGTLVAVTLAALVLAAAGALAARGGTATQSLRIVATQHDFSEIDNGKKGMSAGDVFVFSERLAAGGKNMGSDHIVCTYTGAWPTATDFCRALFKLPGGTLVAEGASARGPFTVAITGGTGSYAGARGTIRATPTKTGEILAIALES
jgi:hypothetical protein